MIIYVLFVEELKVAKRNQRQNKLRSKEKRKGKKEDEKHYFAVYYTSSIISSYLDIDHTYIHINIGRQSHL